MSQINRVQVVIDGEVFELSSPESPEHIQNVARYIDRKIKEIYSFKSEAAINARLRTLFISLNIADDLFKEKREKSNLYETIARLETDLDGYKNEIASLMEEREALKLRIEELEKEVIEAENNLNEYIEVFELNEGIKNNKIKRLN
ncbi:MAG: cell division protein ZapA [Lachnospiraceae bacterium]|nr:cell division protein ZapA [Lachnospiraceae bacterium]